jgi:protein TonB
MFEDALMESGNTIKRKSKWSFVAFLVNFGALVALAIWPLLHPEALPTQMMATLMVAPSPPPPPPPAGPAVKVQTKSEMLGAASQAPSRIPKPIKQVNEAAIPLPMDGVGCVEGLCGDNPGGMSSIFEGVPTGQPTIVRSKALSSLSISSGVMAGNLLAGTFPQYPAIARAAHVQGIVVLQATISKDGSIENLRVISGPSMLQQAAKDAVRSWHYKPYLLNGEPVAVETTINVVFNLGQ